jgi:hypothetical protein
MQRTVKASVYLSPAELQRIRVAAAQAGFSSISDYMRSLAGLPTKRDERKRSKLRKILETKQE